MDFHALDAQLDRGEQLVVTYRYPVIGSEGQSCCDFKIRTDRLLAVEPSNGRVFVRFKGEPPVWIESHEVVKIEPGQ